MAGPRGVEIAASTMINLPDKAWHAEDFITAEKHSQAALSILKEISSPTTTETSLIGECIYYLGREWNRRNELGRALKFLQESRTIHRDTSSRESQSTLTTKRNVQKSCLVLGKSRSQSPSAK